MCVRRLRALRLDEQEALVGVELGIVDLSDAAQARKVLWALPAQQVRLAGIVAQELASPSHLEALWAHSSGERGETSDVCGADGWRAAQGAGLAVTLAAARELFILRTAAFAFLLRDAPRPVPMLTLTCGGCCGLL